MRSLILSLLTLTAGSIGCGTAPVLSPGIYEVRLAPWETACPPSHIALDLKASTRRWSLSPLETEGTWLLEELGEALLIHGEELEGAVLFEGVSFDQVESRIRVQLSSDDDGKLMGELATWDVADKCVSTYDVKGEAL